MFCSCCMTETNDASVDVVTPLAEEEEKIFPKKDVPGEIEKLPLVRVVIAKKDGKKLGLKFREFALEIIRKDGAFQEWLDANPESKVQLNDRVIEVNGKTDGQSMRDEIINNDQLDMLFEPYSNYAPTA